MSARSERQRIAHNWAHGLSGTHKYRDQFARREDGSIWSYRTRFGQRIEFCNGKRAGRNSAGGLPPAETAEGQGLDSVGDWVKHGGFSGPWFAVVSGFYSVVSSRHQRHIYRAIPESSFCLKVEREENLPPVDPEGLPVWCGQFLQKRESVFWNSLETDLQKVSRSTLELEVKPGGTREAAESWWKQHSGVFHTCGLVVARCGWKPGKDSTDFQKCAAAVSHQQWSGLEVSLPCPQWFSDRFREVWFRVLREKDRKSRRQQAAGLRSVELLQELIRVHGLTVQTLNLWNETASLSSTTCSGRDDLLRETWNELNPEADGSFWETTAGKLNSQELYLKLDTAAEMELLIRRNMNKLKSVEGRILLELNSPQWTKLNSCEVIRGIEFGRQTGYYQDEHGTLQTVVLLSHRDGRRLKRLESIFRRLCQETYELEGSLGGKNLVQLREVYRRLEVFSRAIGRIRAAFKGKIEGRTPTEELQRIKAVQDKRKLETRLVDWRAGKNVSLDWSYFAFLRIAGDQLETSNHATFPLSLAEAVVRKCTASDGSLIRENVPERLGIYQIRVSENGQELEIGCHRFMWSEIRDVVGGKNNEAGNMETSPRVDGPPAGSREI